jgi:hypothetical protein
MYVVDDRDVVHIMLSKMQDVIQGVGMRSEKIEMPKM